MARFLTVFKPKATTAPAALIDGLQPVLEARVNLRLLEGQLVKRDHSLYL